MLIALLFGSAPLKAYAVSSADDLPIVSELKLARHGYGMCDETVMIHDWRQAFQNALYVGSKELAELKYEFNQAEIHGSYAISLQYSGVNNDIPTSIDIMFTQDPSAYSEFVYDAMNDTYFLEAKNLGGYMRSFSVGFNNDCQPENLRVLGYTSNVTFWAYIAQWGADPFNLSAYESSFDTHYPSGYSGPSVPSATSLSYVAIGDSFSSGEGVEPFDPVTAIPSDPNASPDPWNECHRSELAYAHLLDQDGSLNLNLQSFRACSGATTQTMVSGQYGEGNQLSDVTPDTDVVTMTAGGNDVGFGNFVRDCLEPDSQGCGIGTPAHVAIANKTDQLLPGRLESLFDDIQVKLTAANTNAKVYVVGYPYVIKQNPLSCNYGLLDSGEQYAGEEVTFQLNQKIKAVVNGYGDNRFEYVSATSAGSPFDGHSMCGPDPYFNGFSINPSVPQVFTAHPNQQGQEAYAELIASHLN